MSNWQELIEQDKNQVLINPEEHPENESEEHFGKKLIAADFLKNELECEKVSLETPEEFEHALGLRFDVFAKKEDKNIAFEAGDFNTPARKIYDRLKRSYRIVDYILWWPHRNQFMKYFDSFRSVKFSCDHCKKPMAAIGVIPWSIKFSEFFTGKPYLIDLLHLFEPGIWHEKNEGGDF